MYIFSLLRSEIQQQRKMLEKIPKNTKEFDAKSILSHKQPKIDKQNRISLLPNQNIFKPKRQRCKLPEVLPNTNNRRNQSCDKTNLNSVNLNPTVQLTDAKPSNVSKQYRCSLLPINFNSLLNPVVEDQKIRINNQKNKQKQKSSIHSTAKSFSLQIEDLEVGQVVNGKKKSPQIKKQQLGGKRNLFNSKLKATNKKETQNYINTKLGNMENEVKNKKMEITKKNSNQTLINQKGMHLEKNRQPCNQQLSDTEIIINFCIISSRSSIEEEDQKHSDLLLNNSITNYYENEIADDQLGDSVNQHNPIKVTIKLVSQKQIQGKDMYLQKDGRTKNTYSVAYQKPQYSQQQKKKQNNILKKYKKQQCIHIHRNISALISPKAMTKNIESLILRKSENELEQHSGPEERRQKDKEYEQKNSSNQAEENQDEECFLSSKIKSTKSIINEGSENLGHPGKKGITIKNEKDHEAQCKEMQGKKEDRETGAKVTKSTKHSILKMNKNNSQGSSLYSLNLSNICSKPGLKEPHIEGKGKLRPERGTNQQFRIHQCLQSAKQQLKIYSYK